MSAASDMHGARVLPSVTQEPFRYDKNPTSIHMKHLMHYALVAALATPALAADTKITTTNHTDAAKSMMGGETPAKDTTQTTWIGKDRMRIENGDNVQIVRNDLKKMYFVHTADKTYSVVDLPVDMKKILPADAAPYIEGMAASMKVTLTPTTETKKIKDWNTTKYTMTTTMQMGPMPMTMTHDVWVTKDVTISGASDLYCSVLSMAPGGAAIIAEYKKIEGFPILTEKTISMMGNDTKSKDEVTSIESKDAPEGSYDVPKDFKEKPFDFMTDNPNGGMGGPGGGRRGKPGGMGGGGRPGGPPPNEPPKNPPTPPK